MKKLVLTASLIAVCSVVSVAVPASAQTPEPQPAPAPATLRMIDVMSDVARSQNVAIAPIALVPEQAPPAPRPATAPAAPRPPQAPRATTPEPPAPLQPVPPPATIPSTPARPAANIRFDVTITDSGGAKPVTKTISLTVNTLNGSGSIRNTARLPGLDQSVPVPTVTPAGVIASAVPLNVDVRQVSWSDADTVRATISVEYQPFIPDTKSQPGVISATANSLFTDGRRTQILVASDPVSDRKTTIEVTATIVK